MYQSYASYKPCKFILLKSLTKVRVLSKKGRLKEALTASLKKVRLIEELEWELIQQVKTMFWRVIAIFIFRFRAYIFTNKENPFQLPWALLDFCELAAVNRAMKERGGLENEQSEDVRLSIEEVEDAAVEDDFKRKAIALAATFGDSSVYRYK